MAATRAGRANRQCNPTVIILGCPARPSAIRKLKQNTIVVSVDDESAQIVCRHEYLLESFLEVFAKIPSLTPAIAGCETHIILGQGVGNN